MVDHEAETEYKTGSTGVVANASLTSEFVRQEDQVEAAPPKQPAGEQHTPAPDKPQQPSSGNAPAPTAPASADWDKKIVKTANLKVEVKNFRSFNERLHNAIRQAGGYIAQEEQNQSSYQIENTVTIKILVDRFDEAVSQLASDSDKLVEKKISAEDVTMQIVDTRSRLETKKEVRERYLDLLKQARNMKDILTVQNEINDIQEQMEGCGGGIGCQRLERPGTWFPLPDKGGIRGWVALDQHLTDWSDHPLAFMDSRGADMGRG